MKFFIEKIRALFEIKRVRHKDTKIIFKNFYRVRKWVSEEDLERAIRYFFKKRNLDLQENGIKLMIEFRKIGGLGHYKDEDTSFQKGGDAITHYYKSRSRVRVCTKKLRRFFNFRKSDSTVMLVILAHELDHIIWAYENKGEFDHVISYDMRPHEVRAYKHQKHWARVILEQLTGK